MTPPPMAFKPMGPYSSCMIGGQRFELISDGGELQVAVGPVIDGITGRERYKLLPAWNDDNIAHFYTFRIQ